MRLTLVLFLFLTLPLQALQVIIIMGPSCAGKSTLSKELCNKLATTNRWHVVDFDEVEENIDLLIATTNKKLAKGSNIIIDTNTYQEKIERKITGAATITKIIATAPLEILLERDNRRTHHLNRSAPRARQCRNFVIHSFNNSLTWPADFYIDPSEQSVRQAGDMIFNFLKQFTQPI